MMVINFYDKLDNKLSKQLIKQVALIEARTQPDSHWSASVLQEFLVSERTQLIMMQSHSQGKPVVAYCLYQVIFETAEILRMGTHPKWQRQGIANSLLVDLFKRLKDSKLKVESLLLEVRVDNKSAINLYKKNGFEQVDCRKGYYRLKNNAPAVDGLIMKREFGE